HAGAVPQECPQQLRVLGAIHQGNGYFAQVSAQRDPTMAASSGQTIAQKILARAAGRDTVAPGEYVNCVPDHVVTQEMVWPVHKRNLENIGATKFARPEKAIIVIDHTPAAATGSPHAATHHMLRKLTREFGVENFY